MTWRGTLRSINAANNRLERAANRRRRLLLEQQKAQLKATIQQQAALEVQLHESEIERLVSLHQECAETQDWRELSETNPPEAPASIETETAAAEAKLHGYMPSFIDKLFGRVQRKQGELQAGVEAARQRDAAATRDAHAQYQKDHSEWETLRSIAAGVLAGDPAAYARAIGEVNPFSEIAGLGASIQHRTKAAWYVEATLKVNSSDVLPREVKSLTQSGKLSVKKMPQGRFSELHQDYVCSAVIRTARELFALLPIDVAFVNAVDDLLNSATGHKEKATILSVALTRKGLYGLNLDTIDCSDAMENFVHEMDFSKTQGFAAVEPLKPSAFERQ